MECRHCRRGQDRAALAQYKGFRERGFKVIAIYDTDPARIGRTLDGVVVRDQQEPRAM